MSDPPISPVGTYSKKKRRTSAPILYNSPLSTTLPWATVPSNSPSTNLFSRSSKTPTAKKTKPRTPTARKMISVSPAESSSPEETKSLQQKKLFFNQMYDEVELKSVKSVPKTPNIPAIAFRHPELASYHSLPKFVDTDLLWSLSIRMEWVYLPRELVLEVFSYLDSDNLFAVSSTCKVWYDLSKEDSLWQRICYVAWATGYPDAGQSWKELYLQKKRETFFIPATELVGDSPYMSYGKWPKKRKIEPYELVMPDADASAVFDKDQAPAVFDKDQAPPVFDKDQTPPVFDKDQTPPVFDKDQAPAVFDKDQAPPVFDTDQAPAVFDTDQAPPVFDTDQPPL